MPAHLRRQRRAEERAELEKEENLKRWGPGYQKMKETRQAEETEEKAAKPKAQSPKSKPKTKAKKKKAE